LANPERFANFGLAQPDDQRLQTGCIGICDWPSGSNRQASSLAASKPM
jgi:hypothetical protein